jgi:hypothetical protein
VCTYIYMCVHICLFVYKFVCLSVCCIYPHHTFYADKVAQLQHKLRDMIPCYFCGLFIGESNLNIRTFYIVMYCNVVIAFLEVCT